MGKFLDYNNYASKYAYTRQAVEWILTPLSDEIKTLPSNSTVLEIGTGTGNYIISISKIIPKNSYKAFDISIEMLNVAKSRSNLIEFKEGNADESFPYKNKSIDLAFAVDVIHHITNLESFFKECYRILKFKKTLLIAANSKKDLKRMSLTKYFPEILEIELSRYPEIEELNEFAAQCGFELLKSENTGGVVPIEDSLISRFEVKCSSATRIIDEKDHRKGIDRLREAERKGEKWISSYTILKYLTN